MFTWANYVYERERYENLRREAAQAWMVRQAFPRPPAGMRPHHRALAWLGCQLTVWGCRLTEHYGGITDTTAPTCPVQSAG
jgi:hypothetical protein